ncbi:MAG: DUF4349 domain-containing protein [Bacteroidia bacterium]|nr:DUF4349 domain-containing protein [Bacteroidia bacterium]
MKNAATLTLILLASIYLLACNTTRKAAPGPYRNLMQFNDYQLINDDEVTPDTVMRKVVYRGEMSLTVKNREQTGASLARLAQQYHGYVQHSSLDQYVIRVESTHLAAAMDSIAYLGRVTHRATHADDITDGYRDDVARLQQTRQVRDRYLALLERAEKVEEILLIEKELERINREIESLQDKLARMDDQLRLSPITVDLQEQVKPGVIGYVFVGLYRGIEWLFVRR